MGFNALSWVAEMHSGGNCRDTAGSRPGLVSIGYYATRMPAHFGGKSFEAERPAKKRQE